ncbi:hypothetical protein [Cryobacterium sp. HLT2-28]|uniref:hypothetical protein n=1 Tax=Cryobacterium sp. HLT2-28 TaxID=1259146 RepID=UPI00106A3BE1|nr:hypothetical protein [Cryobacterium sp. HLT2-28]TFB91708.1 hypothetical protein E3O48_14725 [Cryobacterium sp. HLT2-28]
MTTRWARFARGWIAALFSTFVAALSHTLGGGSGPGLVPVALSLAFAGIVCVGLAGRTLSLWRVSLSVLASQLIFHGLFSLGGSGGAMATPSAAPHDHRWIAVLADPALLAAPGSGRLGSGAMTGAMAGGPADGIAMRLAHLAAAAVTILALRFGERAFWGLLENACPIIRALFAQHPLVLPPRSPRRMVTTARVFTPRDLRVLLSVMRHRGPPVSLPA